MRIMFQMTTLVAVYVIGFVHVMPSIIEHTSLGNLSLDEVVDVCVLRFVYAFGNHQATLDAGTATSPDNRRGKRASRMT
jgi:hypothetical protein